MGLLNRADATRFRTYFSEMCKLIGISVSYQYITKGDMTIHSEPNNNYSMPIRIDVLFDENPTVDTLNRIGWVSELGDQKPVIINLPFNTPKLTVGARIMVESNDGVARPRLFMITKIASDLEFPDAYTCAMVPVFDQYPQANEYTLINHEKVDQEQSKRTSADQPYKYITSEHEIDTVPKKYVEWSNEYNFIDNQDSPYSG